jgi:hypothetical protein
MGAFDDLIPGAKPAGGGAFDDLIPQRSTGDELLRQGGRTVRHVAEGVAGLASPFANALGAAWNQTAGRMGAPRAGTDAVGAVSALLDQLGLPKDEGALEEVIGAINRAAVAGGGVNAAAQRGTGAVAQSLAARPGAQLAGEAGGAAAGEVARQQDAGPVGQMLAMLAGGVLAPGAVGATAEVGKAAARGGRELLAPFTAGGRERIVGRTINRFAEDAGTAAGRMERAPAFVPGSEPTAAQAGRDVGLFQLERGLAATDPRFAARKSQQNAARTRALDSMAGTKDDLAQAERARASEGARLYGEALDGTPKPTPEIREELRDLEKRPAFREALSRAVKMVENEGGDVPRLKDPRKSAGPKMVDDTKDDIVSAVRKLGGINPGDEAIGSIARDMGFGPDPTGPVFRRQQFGSSSGGNRTATVAGHSLEEMARKLHERGYVSSPDALDEVVEKLYDSSRGVGQHFSKFRAPPNDDPLAGALDRLTEQLATKGAPKEAKVDLAASGGVKLAHYTKTALDDMIEQAVGKGQKNEARVLMGLRDKFVGMIESDDFSPAYRNARESFAAASKPVDQLTALQQIRDRTRNAGTDAATGEHLLSAEKWFTNVTKRADDLGKVLDEPQMMKLRRIGLDLERGALSDSAGRAAGSNTFQNLSTANVLGAALGGKLADSPIARSIARPLEWLYKVPEADVRELLTQAMLDPALARSLMAKGTKPNVEFLASALRDKARGLGIGTAVATGTAGRPVEEAQ